MARRFRVLVADDNEDAANSLAMLLELDGYDVRIAYDGEMAVQLAAHWTPDAAILDIKMPGRDGYSVAQALRARLFKSVVLIAHSGELTIGQRDFTASSLFDRCCTKGMALAELREWLERLLEEKGPKGWPQSRPPTRSSGGSQGGPAGPGQGS